MRAFFYTTTFGLAATSPTQTYTVNRAEFDGSSDLNAGNILDVTTGDFSLSCDVNLPMTQRSRLMGKTEASPNNGYFLEILSDGSLHAGVDSGANAVSINTTGTYALTANTDYNIQVLYEAGVELRVYVDDVLIATSGSASSVGSLTTSADFCIGYVPSTGSHRMVGEMSRPLVYKRLLTSAEQTAIAQLPSLCWKLLLLEEAGLSDASYAPPLYNGAGVSLGQELTDKSSNSESTTNNGVTFTGTADIECEIPTTQIYTANVAKLNGTNQYFTGTGVGGIFQPTATLSTGTWFTADTVNVDHRLNTSYGASLSERSWNTAVSGPREDVTTFFYDGSSVVGQASSTTTLTAGTQYNAVTVYDGADNKLYLDNVLEATTPYVGSIDAGLDEWHLGHQNRGTQLHDGNFWCSWMTSEVLTTGDLTELYNEGTAPCFDLLSTALQAKFTGGKGEYVYLANWTGTTGEELIGQANGTVFTNFGTTPFTGTADIECVIATTQIYSANVINLDGGSAGTLSTGWAIPPEGSASIWAKIDPTQPEGYGRFFAQWPSVGAISTRAFSMAYDKTNAKVEVVLHTTTAEFPSTSFPSALFENVWTLYTLTWGSGSLKIYTGTTLQGTVAYTGTANQTTLGVAVGSASDYGHKFKGQAYSPIITSSVLSIGEIDTLNESKCFGSSGITDAIYAPPLYNHVDFTGLELIDQSPLERVTINAGGQTFTGTANIECNS